MSPASPTPPARPAPWLTLASLLGLAVTVPLGYLAGGPATAAHAAVGMGAAILGGVAAALVIALTSRPGHVAAATPTLAMVVRLAVTAAAVGFAIRGLNLPQRPVLFAALFGYLCLMAAEVAMLYRLASCRPAAAGRPAEPHDA